MKAQAAQRHRHTQHGGSHLLQDVCQKKRLGHIKALCWRVTCARAGFKCHRGSLGIPAQLSMACYCPIKCPQHTFTQCCCFSHCRNTEVNPLCWGMWCHRIVIYRKRQQLWLGFPKSDMPQTAAAMPFPGLLLTPLVDAGRDFPPLILRITVSRMKSALSQCSCNSNVDQREHAQVKEQSLLCQYCCHTGTWVILKTSQGRAQWRYQKFKLEQGNSDESTTAVMR